MILLDPFSCFFLSTVLIISSSIYIYIIFYMHADIFFTRFIILVLLFVGAMLCLITTLNLVSILLGWDGLGVTSYLLVIYYQRSKSNNAGIITALTNRVGDVAIVLAIGLILNQGSWNFYLKAISERNEFFPLFMFLICTAAITKRAQLPFSAWLPAAMAAPHSCFCSCSFFYLSYCRSLSNDSFSQPSSLLLFLLFYIYYWEDNFYFSGMKRFIWNRYKKKLLRYLL